MFLLIFLKHSMFPIGAEYIGYAMNIEVTSKRELKPYPYPSNFCQRIRLNLECYTAFMGLMSVSTPELHFVPENAFL